MPSWWLSSWFKKALTACLNDSSPPGNGWRMVPLRLSAPTLLLCVLNQLLINHNIILPYSYRAIEKEWCDGVYVFSTDCQSMSDLENLTGSCCMKHWKVHLPWIQICFHARFHQSSMVIHSKIPPASKLRVAALKICCFRFMTFRCLMCFWIKDLWKLTCVGVFNCFNHLLYIYIVTWLKHTEWNNWITWDTLCQ